MPQVKPPTICLPDTNSLIHLRDIIVDNKRACLRLWDEFEVKISDEIPRELQRNENKNPDHKVPEINGKLANSVIALKADLNTTENCFLTPIGFGFDEGHARDLGERKNTQLAIQLLAQNQTRQAIFLTDERKSIELTTGFVRGVFNNYPLGIIWNSMDFLLYLFFRHRRYQYLKAQDDIREVNRRIGGKTEVAVKRLTNYSKRLSTIDGARQQVPILWL